MRWLALAVVCISACAPVAPRFPADVQAAVAHADMRKLETDLFIVYYKSNRRQEVDRFLAHADRCARQLRTEAFIKVDRKFVIVMPDAPFNNAFVAPGALGYEEVSVIPTYSTLDFATQFGLPPDPGYIACHELVHYVHVQQNAGFWGTWNEWFGPTYTPQAGYDPWFLEGLATHYEARLSPGSGRPAWPLFRALFAAAYAGKHIDSGELSSFGRLASVGHHYLVGSMFVDFLAEKYGERPLWATIASQSKAFTGWFYPGTFKSGFGVGFSELLDQFAKWVNERFPVRAKPSTMRTLATLGNDARYARGRDGTEAWIALDVDAPARLTIRDPQGHVLVEDDLVEIFPGRTLVQAEPLLISGLSITADGREVWVTVIDQGATYMVPRTLRWRRGEGGLSEVRSDLGPGASIDPTGSTYYYEYVDGDRWSLAAFDTKTGAARTVIDMQPGTYVLGAQVSPDGKRLAANVWNGTAFVIWVIDAATGAVTQRIGGRGLPVYDASFTSDGRLMWLGEVDRRFQVIVDGYQITDAPYSALAAREANGTIRFLDREGWNWELAEVATPPPVDASSPTPPSLASQASEQPPSGPSTAVAPPTVQSDTAYSGFDHLFYPAVRAPTITVGGGLPHFGLVLGGGDRLGMQRWSIAGYAQPKASTITDRTHYGASFGYANAMLAPINIIAQGGFLDWAAPVATTDPMVTLTEERKTRDASLILERTWRQTFTVDVGGIYTDDRYQLETDPNIRRRVAGPSAALSWYSADTTRYTGPQRALLLSAQGGFYPHQLSTFMGDITDVGGTLGIVAPLPIGRRHTISATIRGRALIAKDETGLLQVGGDSALGALWNRSSVSMTSPEFDTSRFPPGFRFVEPLRGYEDYAITTDQVEIGELAWKYPLIIDRGTAHFLFLPAFYLRQLDLELFAAGAIDKSATKHYDVGGALTLHLQFLRIPLIVQYQLARRLVDDKALTQFVGLGADI
ncbi:MAG TPA: hypothetical protein VMZ53_31595 [Kofleriaceae bacterium]|nr:hypothetical protein [Kofleriaceae bacterium]